MYFYNGSHLSYEPVQNIELHCEFWLSYYAPNNISFPENIDLMLDET